MPKVTPEPALPVDTDGMPWIATGPGKSFRPLRSANAETQRAVYLAWCRDHGVHPSGRILG